VADASTTTSPRRSVSEHAPSRTALLDAAQRLILDEGYAAVSARRVAARAGLKPQLVHYYFASMDELFVQLVHRDAAAARVQLDRALANPRPLHALWELSTDPMVTALSMEYLAVANHRKAIAAEVAAAAEAFRQAQHDAFRQALDRHDVDAGGIPVGVLLLALEGLARVLVMEGNVGAHAFHADAVGYIEDALRRLEGPAPT
jgi:AcrR family transcriptional regulator